MVNADVNHGSQQKLNAVPEVCCQLQHALHAVLRCVDVLLFRYENFLFYGSSKTKEMCYYTHLAGITKVFNVLGILSGKKTHAPRGSGARDTHERRYSPVMHSYEST